MSTYIHIYRLECSGNLKGLDTLKNNNVDNSGDDNQALQSSQESKLPFWPSNLGCTGHSEKTRCDAILDPTLSHLASFLITSPHSSWYNIWKLICFLYCHIILHKAESEPTFQIPPDVIQLIYHDFCHFVRAKKLSSLSTPWLWVPCQISTRITRTLYWITVLKAVLKRIRNNILSCSIFISIFAKSRVTESGRAVVPLSNITPLHSWLCIPPLCLWHRHRNPRRMYAGGCYPQTKYSLPWWRKQRCMLLYLIIPLWRGRRDLYTDALDSNQLREPVDVM